MPGVRPFAVLFAVLLLLGAGPVVPGPAAGEGVLSARPAAAQTGTRGRVTGLPIPRFVSLRPDTVNLRTGPGRRYPIEWVYQRAGMPVEVIGEYGTWRQIRDWQGDTGWVHQVMLQADRTARVLGGAPQPLLRAPEADARQVAKLQPGVIAELERCRDRWCRLSAGGHTGWMRRDAFYGVYPGETVGD
jgi:SH3-like domain-containing protein